MSHIVHIIWRLTDNMSYTYMSRINMPWHILIVEWESLPEVYIADKFNAVDVISFGFRHVSPSAGIL